MSTEQPPVGGDVVGRAPGRGSSGSDATGTSDTPGAGTAGSAEPAGNSAEPAGSGPALARAALDAALAKRRVAPRPSRGQRLDTDGTATRAPRRRARGYTGPGPDPRDPQPLAVVLAKLVKARGWRRPAAEATVFGAWERLVGEDVAAHCRPVKLDAGELTVEAESTAWATQLRLLAGRLLARIAAEVGQGVVTRLHIHGPAAPSWRRGPRRVAGRGPRDTYG